MKDRCGYCNHLVKKHCKVGTQHSSYKEDARMVEIKWRKLTVNCVSRHCLEPLCDCTDFVETEEETNVPTI